MGTDWRLALDTFSHSIATGPSVSHHSTEIAVSALASYWYGQSARVGTNGSTRRWYGLPDERKSVSFTTSIEFRRDRKHREVCFRRIRLQRFLWLSDESIVETVQRAVRRAQWRVVERRPRIDDFLVTKPA